MAEMQTLIERYQSKVAALESQLAEAQRKLGAITEVARIMEEEGISAKEAPLFQPQVQVISQKYAELNMTDAILDVLANRPDSTAREIQVELERNGFKSGESFQARDVYVKLYRLAEKGRIIATKKHGNEPKRYIRAEGEKTMGKQAGDTAHLPVKLSPPFGD